MSCLRGWAVTISLGLGLACGAPAAFAGAGTESPGQAAFDQAMKALNSDDASTAEQRFLEAIQLDRAMADAYWRLATVYYRQKKFHQAVELLRRCPKQDSLEIKEQLGLNLYLTATPPPPEAVRLLEEVTAARPEAHAAQLQLGQHFVRTQPDRATAALKLYLQHRPASAAKSDGAIEFLLGSAALHGKDWELAQQKFTALLRDRPDDLTLQLMLGAALVGKSASDPAACSPAARTYEKILGAGPRQPSIYYNLATCYLKLTRPADAERQAAEYTRAKPADARGFLLLGEAQQAQSRLQPARASFERALKLEPESTLAMARLGLAELALGNLQAATTQLDRAEVRAPEDLDVACAQVAAYAKLHLGDKLRKKAQQLAQQAQARAQKCAGDAHLATDNTDEAIATYQAAMTLDARTPGASAGLVVALDRRAWAEVDRKNFPAAVTALERALRLEPKDVGPLRSLARVQLLAGKPAEAVRLLGEHAALVAADLQLGRLLARAQLDLGKREAARAQYERLMPDALRAGGSTLAAVQVELGAIHLLSDHLDAAIDAFERALRVGQRPIDAVAQHDLALALLRRGLARGKAGQAAGALEDLSRAVGAARAAGLPPREQAAIDCAEGVAAIRAERLPLALAAFQRARTGGGCALGAGYRRLGAEFLHAYAGFRAGAAREREDAARKLAELLAAGNDPHLRGLLRSALEWLAYEAYQRNEDQRAEGYLRKAARVSGEDEGHILEHNQAVVDLAMGRVKSAEKALTGLGGAPAEALLNLGIARDRVGDGEGALQLYRRAWKRGVHTPRLKEWIETKERFFGEAGS